MKTETYDNPADFMAALSGKRPSKRTSAPRSAAVAKGEGDRLSALVKLAKAGWCALGYVHSTGVFSYRNVDGRTVEAATYRAVIDLALEQL